MNNEQVLYPEEKATRRNVQNLNFLAKMAVVLFAVTTTWASLPAAFLGLITWSTAGAVSSTAAQLGILFAGLAFMQNKRETSDKEIVLTETINGHLV